MTIWIDAPAWPAHGRLWSHLISDTSFEELHAFAAANGLPRRGFEGDHYDVPDDRYAALLAAGARAADGREIVRMLQVSGLRIPKRRHERVLHSEPNPPWLPAGSRVDVIASRQGGPPTSTAVVRLLAHAAGSVLVVTREDGGLDLPSARVLAGALEDALAGVQQEALGGPGPAHHLGYVRNTVPHPEPGYPWPTPQACFALFAREVDPAQPFGRGHWISLNEAADRLGERHWWPLLPEFFSRPVH